MYTVCPGIQAACVFQCHDEYVCIATLSLSLYKCQMHISILQEHSYSSWYSLALMAVAKDTEVTCSELQCLLPGSLGDH